MSPSVASIDPHLPFVDLLAAGILDRVGDDPLDLASCLILLPTRRACRALREAFLRASGGKASLLPRMLPLGDLDEDDLDFGADLPGAAALPPAISPLRRQMLLTRLILAGKGGPRAASPSPDQAALLAKELGRLLDQVRTEGLSFDNLEGLPPDAFAEHWRVVLEFLKIVTHHWPAILKENGGLDHAERRNRVLETQAEAWAANPPDFPIIAAGSTGSIPATARLLKVISCLPKGYVVLPGLDREMDEDSWTALAETHPQYGLKQLLTQLETARDAVPDWRAAEGPDPRFYHKDRLRLAREALRPAETTQAWRDLAPFNPRALEGLELVACPGLREEALSVALMMRETLETEAKTAALITPDRDLARRVASELARWGVEVDDSAGAPLSLTPPGAFLRLTVRAVAEDFAPAPLLALLKHPLAAGGREPGAFRALARALELAALRGPRPAPGLEGLRAELGANALLDDLEKAVSGFADLMAAEEASFADLLEAHMTFAETLANAKDLPGPARLWAGEAGEQGASLMAELHEHGTLLPPLAPSAYPALLDAFLSGAVVRPPQGGHPRLFIWGPLEARLQQADLIILGGLNEGTWPPETTADPWMSRPMRHKFGLPLPERRIGLAAHDFAQAFCAPRVVMTRSQRVEGTPTVPSRWLLRLNTVLEAAGQGLREEGFWRDWAALLDRADKVSPQGPPTPRPPLAARPKRLSVTQVETWMRDPYAIYARHILGLEVLKPIDDDPGAADYGSLAHDALETFTKTYPKDAPERPLEKLLEIGEETFRAVLARPGVRAFWWPRFKRIAAWFVEQEAERRSLIAETHVEIKGEHCLGDFTVTAKADRIDLLKDGTLSLIDYKTGAPPTKKEVAAGFAPQLPLEAVIAEAGGFPGVSKRPVSQLLYWRLKGDEAGGEESTAGDDVRALADQALEGLIGLAAAFADENTPYAARPHPDMAPKYSDYLHLARVREWASSGEGEE